MANKINIEKEIVKISKKNKGFLFDMTKNFVKNRLLSCFLTSHFL